MDPIAYTCPFIPAEWIAAHGLEPRRILPESKRRIQVIESSEGTCHFLREFINGLILGERVDGIIFSTVCDQMRRAPEILKLQSLLPVFLLNVPATWQMSESHRLYVSELRRLGYFLVEVGGESPSQSKLSQVMLDYDKTRTALHNARGLLDARAFSEAIANFHRTGELILQEGGRSAVSTGVPVAILGGPLSAQDFILFDIIQKAGGTVVLDGTETGERTMARSFHRQQTRKDPLLELADAYFGHIPDPFRRPNSEFYRWIKQKFLERLVRGVLLIRNVWCDIWHAEVERMRTWLKIPLLDIDLDGEDPALRNRTRIQAFLETLQ